MDIWIGTSGYSYSSWVGDFYPSGTGSARMLPYYCRHFPLVELNYTFYRVPTPEMLRRQAEQSPAGFQFIVKVPQTISHEECPRELPSFRLSVEELRHNGKLLGLLHPLLLSIHHSNN